MCCCVELFLKGSNKSQPHLISMAGLGMITGREEEVLVSYQTKSTALVVFKVHWILAVSQSREALLGKSSVTQWPIGCELSSIKGFGGDQLVLIKVKT